MKSFYSSVFSFCLLSGLIFSSCTESTEEVFEGEPEVVVSGFQFTEGPYWHPDGYLIFSDIPANKVYKWTPGNSEVEVYIDSSGNSNGIAAMPDGTLLLAQHAGKVSMVNEDMELVPIAEKYDGKRFNSPNDVAVRSDGLIYFTDPTFGVSDENRELDITGVYRINQDHSLTLVYEDIALPNGIVFSPDESSLYVSDSETGQIIRFDVLKNGDIENPTEFANVGTMVDGMGADGMTTDAKGRLYTTGVNGLIVFDEEGNQLAHISFDNQVTNVVLKPGQDLNDLFITCTSDIFRLRVNK